MSGGLDGQQGACFPQLTDSQAPRKHVCDEILRGWRGVETRYSTSRMFDPDPSVVLEDCLVLKLNILVSASGEQAIILI